MGQCAERCARSAVVHDHVVSDAGNTEEFGDQRAGEGKGFEQHEVGRERLSVTQDVIDHLVDTDLGEGPREEVVQDALGRESVAGVAARARGESLDPVGLALSGQGEPRPGLLDEGAASGPDATTTSSPPAANAPMIGTSGVT